MASTEAEAEDDIPGLDLINTAKETAMNSCNSIKKSLGIWHIIRLLISPLIHAIDIGTDVNLAYRYYSDNEYLYSGLTSFFVVGPTILVSLLQKMYFQDFSPGSILKWIFQMILMVLPISPFVSSFQALNHVTYLKRTVTDFAENPDLDKFDAFKSRYDTLVKEKSSSAMVGVAEGFLQSAPQLVLQLTIILSRERLAGSVYLYVSLISSFASTMKAFVGFYNSVQKNKTTWIGTILLYLWSTFIITSRVLAISQGMAVHIVETSFICLIHWFGMTMWLSFLENTRYYTEPKEGKLGKLLGQIPLDKMKLETITNMGTQLKGEAVAKVGALASIFSQKEVKADKGEVNEEVTENEVKTNDKGETQDRAEPDGEEKAQGKESTEGEVKAPSVGNKITFKKIFFGGVFGLIYIFVYVSITEKPTRNKYAFFYFVWFLENCFFLILGCQELYQNGAWFFLILRAATFGGVVVSLVIMTIYVLFHQPLWPKKVDASGGFGLENAYQYGLSSIQAIDPTQLIPLKSINPAQFIPSLNSLPSSIPGSELISNLIPGKVENAAGEIPGAQLISGLLSGKGEGSTSAVPGAELISGLLSGKEESSTSAVPGAQLISGLLPGKDESSTSTVPGAQLITGLISGKEGNSTDGLIRGGGLISGLIPRKEENSSGNNSDTQHNSESIAEKEENLSCAIPGANLISSLATEKEEGSSATIPKVLLTPGNVESVSSMIPGSQLVSGLIPKNDESGSDSTPATQLISGLIPGNGDSSFKLWGK